MLCGNFKEGVIATLITQKKESYSSFLPFPETRIYPELRGEKQELEKIYQDIGDGSKDCRQLSVIGIDMWRVAARKTLGKKRRLHDQSGIFRVERAGKGERRTLIDQVGRP